MNIGRVFANGKLDRVTNPVWAILTAAMAFFALQDSYYYADPVALAYFALHAVTGVLFLIRRPPVAASANPVAYLAALAGMSYVFLYDVSVPTEGVLFWVGDGLLLLGAVTATIATATIGRSFAVLPSARRLRTTGVYRIVRHPLYASYVVMEVGMIMSFPTALNAVVLFSGLALLLMRIRYEEEILSTAFAEYEEYRRQVPWRLVPEIL